MMHKVVLAACRHCGGGGRSRDVGTGLQVNVYMPWVMYSSWVMTTPALLFQIQDIVGQLE